MCGEAPKPFTKRPDETVAVGGEWSGLPGVTTVMWSTAPPLTHPLLSPGGVMGVGKPLFTGFIDEMGHK